MKSKKRMWKGIVVFSVLMFSGFGSGLAKYSQQANETFKQFCERTKLCKNIGVAIPGTRDPKRDPVFCYCRMDAPGSMLIFVESLDSVYLDDADSYIVTLERDGVVLGYIISPDTNTADILTQNMDTLQIIRSSFPFADVNPLLISSYVSSSTLSSSAQFLQGASDFLQTFHQGAAKYNVVWPPQLGH